MPTSAETDVCAVQKPDTETAISQAITKKRERKGKRQAHPHSQHTSNDQCDEHRSAVYVCSESEKTKEVNEHEHEVNEHGTTARNKNMSIRHPTCIGCRKWDGNTWFMGHYLPITDNYWWFIHRALGLGLLASCAAGQPGA